MAKTPKPHEPKKPKPKMWSEEISSKATSMKNEERLSETVGFKQTPGSGNRDWPSLKGDGSHPRFMFELKETQRANISVGERVVSKLYREASNVGKDPVLVLSAYGLPDPLPKDWAVVPIDIFMMLLKAFEEANG